MRRLRTERVEVEERREARKHRHFDMAKVFYICRSFVRSLLASLIFYGNFYSFAKLSNLVQKRNRIMCRRRQRGRGGETKSVVGNARICSELLK